MNTLTLVYVVMFFIGIFLLLLFVVMHYRYRHNLYYSPKPTRFPTISILVPVYNEEKSVADTLNALIKINYPARKKEIIVIDDGSTDRTAEIVRSFVTSHSGIRLLSKKNGGKARALNYGIRFAKGELLAVADADSNPLSNSLMSMVGYFDEQRVAAVTSRVLVRNTPNWLCRYQVLDYSIIAWTRKLLDFVDSVYVTNGPLSVYRTSVVRKIGGFDPTNLTEDIELTWHILSKGYQTRMAYNAIVYTIVPETFAIWVKQRIRWNLGGIQTVVKYWRSMFKNNAFGYFVIPYVAASFILALIGFGLFARYMWIKGSYYLVSFYYWFQGYNPFAYWEFSFHATLLLFLASLFFLLAIGYYKLGFNHSKYSHASIVQIFIYSALYRALYIIPLVLALYKLAKGDLRWYTK